MNTVKRIGIIGAGLAGLNTARVFKGLGYEISVFEKDTQVGGVWAASRRYPGVSTQDSKSVYALPGFPMPEHYPEWPSGEQVQAYLDDFADKVDIKRDIQFQTEVVSTRYDSASETWQLTLKDHAEAGQQSQISVDFLFICNGIYSVPSIPKFEGAEEFANNGGAIYHTSQFNDIELAKDKNVVVVGYGKSSCDVANAVTSVANSTTIVARQLTWKVPRMIANKINNKNMFSTRLSEALFPYFNLKGADKFLHGIGSPIRKGLVGGLSWVIKKQLRLESLGLLPKLPFSSIANSTISQVSDMFYDQVASGQLQVKRDNEIRRLTSEGAELASGETIPVDIIICGTGWQQRCDFLDDSVMDKLTDADGNFQLYRSLLPVEVPRLAFNGYNSSLFTQMCCHVGALWLADYIKGGIQMPSKERQNDGIEQRLNWMAKRTGGKHSNGASLIPFTIHYIDELLNDMNLNLKPLARLKQWFNPFDPDAYAHLFNELKQKYTKETQEIPANPILNQDLRHG